MDSTSIQPGSVVVGVDGSTPSDMAVRWGAAQASLEDRPLALVHGMSPAWPQTGWVGAPSLDPSPVLQELEAVGRAQLEHAADLVRVAHPGLETRQVLDNRDPRDALLSLSGRAAMIILGSRGRGTMVSLVLGSVSLSVALHASCPVVVLRGSEHAHSSKDQDGILVGTDGTSRSDAALAFAFRQASLRSVPLTVLHAFWSEQDEGPYSMARPYERADAEDAQLLVAEAIAGLKADYPEVKVTTRVEHGLPDKVTVHAARHAELVVVGTHSVNALYDVLAGEVSRSVLGHAKCAVAVVPDTPRTRTS